MTEQTEYSIEIHQPRLDTSQLGVMHAANKHYGLPWTDPELYVGCGHAFVTNVRFDLCPSSPYVWNTQPMLQLFSNLNLDVELIGFILPSSASAEDRASFNATLKQALLAGKICTLEHLDHQVVQGFDAEGFILTQPWGTVDKDSTPPKLKFASWEGFSSGPPICAYCVTKREGALNPVRGYLKPAIEYAIDLWDNPDSHTENRDYGMGPAAYPNWLKAIEGGAGEEHGAWWNGIVWSECKKMASRFFGETATGLVDSSNLIRDIKSSYETAATALMTAADLKQDQAVRIEAVRKSQSAEMQAVEKLRELIPLF